MKLEHLYKDLQEPEKYMYSKQISAHSRAHLFVSSSEIKSKSQYESIKKPAIKVKRKENNDFESSCSFDFSLIIIDHRS